MWGHLLHAVDQSCSSLGAPAPKLVTQSDGGVGGEVRRLQSTVQLHQAEGLVLPTSPYCEHVSARSFQGRNRANGYAGVGNKARSGTKVCLVSCRRSPTANETGQKMLRERTGPRRRPLRELWLCLQVPPAMTGTPVPWDDMAGGLAPMVSLTQASSSSRLTS